MVEIPAHKIILCARCPYFQSKFCREWGDTSDGLARFEDFTENAMREVLRYIYTGRLKIDLANIMGVLRIASFLGLEQLTLACKQYLQSGFLNAFDLCLIYCQVREDSTDVEEMRSFLVNIIPEKIENDMLCKVLKEIWLNKSDRRSDCIHGRSSDLRKLSNESKSS